MFSAPAILRSRGQLSHRSHTPVRKEKKRKDKIKLKIENEIQSTPISLYQPLVTSPSYQRIPMPAHLQIRPTAMYAGSAKRPQSAPNQTIQQHNISMLPINVHSPSAVRSLYSVYNIDSPQKSARVLQEVKVRQQPSGKEKERKDAMMESW